MTERTIPLAELIAAQGIGPAHDLDEIGALLPEDWDADGFIAARGIRHDWLMTQRHGEDWRVRA